MSKRVIALFTIGVLGVVGLRLALRHAVPGPSDRDHPAARRAFLVRDTPVAIKAIPVRDCIQREEVAAILRGVPAVYPKAYALTVYPIGTILHALELWGSDVTFPDDMPQFFGQGPVQPKQMIDALLTHAGFVEMARIRSKTLLRHSEFGIEVIGVSDGSFGASETAAHFGNLVDVMASVGQPANVHVELHDGYRGTLREIIQDDAARVVWGAELEWAASGLSRYAACNSPWDNRFGQPQSFDSIASELLKRAIGRGSCGGAHVPYALTLLLRRHQETSILSNDVAERIRRRLRNYAERLTESQAEDGSWSWEWPSAFAGGIVMGKPRIYEESGAGKMMVTGHLLEWMAFAPRDCRPEDMVLTRAVRFIVTNWENFRASLRIDPALYAGATHVARSVWLLSGEQDIGAVAWKGESET